MDNNDNGRRGEVQNGSFTRLAPCERAILNLSPTSIAIVVHSLSGRTWHVPYMWVQNFVPIYGTLKNTRLAPRVLKGPLYRDEILDPHIWHVPRPAEEGVLPIVRTVYRTRISALVENCGVFFG